MRLALQCASRELVLARAKGQLSKHLNMLTKADGNSRGPGHFSMMHPCGTDLSYQPSEARLEAGRARRGKSKDASLGCGWRAGG